MGRLLVLPKTDLAKNINASRIMIEKYERGDNTPSVEVLFHLAKVFEVSLDYLVGEGVNAQFDTEVAKRLKGITFGAAYAVRTLSQKISNICMRSWMRF